MARKSRIHYQGAVNHVIARGNNRENIFNEESDKEKYLNLLKKYKEKYDFLLYAYVLMDNHLHLLVEVGNIPLSKIMQALQLSYTLYFNKKYDRVGHVFQQRYKAVLCQKDEYLLALIKYIHENPKKAGLCSTLNYKWSSHGDYIRAQKNFVSTNSILCYFDNDTAEAVKKYIRFIQDPQDDPVIRNIVPSSDYQPLRRDVERDTEKKGDGGNKLNTVITLEELLANVALYNKISQEIVLRKSKIPKYARARRMFIYLAVSAGFLTRSQAAEYLGISQSAVTKAFNDLENDMVTKNEIDYLLKKMSIK